MWSNIVKAIHRVHTIETGAKQWVSRKVGDGTDTKFWQDCWIGDIKLAARFPRLFALETDKGCSIRDRFDNNNWVWSWRIPVRSGRLGSQFNDLVSLLPSRLSSDEKDSWVWLDGKSEKFMVAIIRNKVQKRIAQVSNRNKTSWIPLVPKKVNLFAWRMLRDCLPTYTNLFARGIDVQTMRCLWCNHGIETSIHIFKRCELATKTRRQISKWIGVIIPDSSPKETMVWIDGLQLQRKKDERLKAIMFTWWWNLWKARNNWIHNQCKERCDDLFFNTMSSAFLWVTKRSNKHQVTWLTWLADPLS